MESSELSEIMGRYQKGDAAAFRALYDALAPAILGLLLRSTRDRAAAEDLLQETFVKIHRARATWRAGSPVKPWVFAIAHHTAISAARSRGRKREDARDDLSGIPAPQADESEDPRVDSIRVALDSLPPDQREAVTLLKIAGLSVAEAAAAAGTSPGALKLRAHRGYEAIRAVLRGKAE